nr:zinc finger, GRF-type [Tanacetum cinerariifolium]
MYWYDPPLCKRVVQIIPNLLNSMNNQRAPVHQNLNSMNNLEAQLHHKSVEARRVKKMLVLSWSHAQMDLEVIEPSFLSLGSSHKEYSRGSWREFLVATQISLLDWSLVFRRAPSGGAELSQFEALQAVIGDVVLTDHSDS